MRVIYMFDPITLIFKLMVMAHWRAKNEVKGFKSYGLETHRHTQAHRDVCKTFTYPVWRAVKIKAQI